MSALLNPHRLEPDADPTDDELAALLRTQPARRTAPARDLAEVRDLEEAIWNEETHPRWPPKSKDAAGKNIGGQFMRVGQRFDKDGHTWEIAHVADGHVIANEASGQIENAETRVFSPTQVGGAPTIVGAVPAAPKKLLTGEGKSHEYNSTVVDGEVHADTHDPSIKLPAISDLTPEEWEQFGKADQLVYVEAMKRFGAWTGEKMHSPTSNVIGAGSIHSNKAAALFAKANEEFGSTSATELVKKSFGKNKGASGAGFNLSMTSVFQQIMDGDTAKLLSAHRKYQQAREVQSELQSLMAWDLMNRTRSPSMTLFHNSNDKEGFFGSIIKGKDVLMSGLSNSWAGTWGEPNTVTAAIPIRHLVFAEELLGYYYHSSEHEFSWADRMRINPKVASFLTHSQKQGDVWKWVSSKVHKAPQGGWVSTGLAGHLAGISELPLDPQTPNFVLKHKPGEKSYYIPPAAVMSKIEASIAANPGEVITDKVPISTLNLKPGDVIEGATPGLRYLVIQDDGLPPGAIRYVALGKGSPGNYDSGDKLYSTSGERKKVNLHFDVPAKPLPREKKSTYDMDAYAPQGDLISVKKFDIGDTLRINNDDWKVTSQSPTATTIVSHSTGAEGEVNPDWKTQKVQSLTVQHEYEAGDLAVFGGKVVRLTFVGAAGDQTISGIKPDGSTFTSAKSGLTPLPPLHPGGAEKGDTFALDGVKMVVTHVLKDGTVRARAATPGAKVQAFPPNDPNLAGLFRPSDYTPGAKGKLGQMPAGTLFSGSPLKTRPYMMLGVAAGNKAHVMNLDTGEVSLFSMNKSYPALATLADVQDTGVVTHAPEPGVEPHELKPNTLVPLQDLSVGDVFKVDPGGVSKYQIVGEHPDGKWQLKSLDTGLVLPAGLSKDDTPVTYMGTAELGDETPAVPAPQVDVGSLPDAAEHGGFQAYTSNAGPKNAYKHDKIKMLSEGTVFLDKTGKAWKVKKGGAHPIITDGQDLYSVDGNLRAKNAIHAKKPVVFSDQSPPVGSVFDEISKSIADTLQPNTADQTLGELDLKKGDQFTADGATWAADAFQSKTLVAFNVDTGEKKAFFKYQVPPKFLKAEPVPSAEDVYEGVGDAIDAAQAGIAAKYQGYQITYDDSTGYYTVWSPDGTTADLQTELGVGDFIQNALKPATAAFFDSLANGDKAAYDGPHGAKTVTVVDNQVAGPGVQVKSDASGAEFLAFKHQLSPPEPEVPTSSPVALEDLRIGDQFKLNDNPAATKYEVIGETPWKWKLKDLATGKELPAGIDKDSTTVVKIGHVKPATPAAPAPAHQPGDSVDAWDVKKGYVVQVKKGGAKYEVMEDPVQGAKEVKLLHLNSGKAYDWKHYYKKPLLVVSTPPEPEPEPTPEPDAPTLSSFLTPGAKGFADKFPVNTIVKLPNGDLVYLKHDAVHGDAWFHIGGGHAAVAGADVVTEMALADHVPTAEDVQHTGKMLDLHDIRTGQTFFGPGGPFLMLGHGDAGVDAVNLQTGVVMAGNKDQHGDFELGTFGAPPVTIAKPQKMVGDLKKGDQFTVPQGYSGEGEAYEVWDPTPIYKPASGDLPSYWTVKVRNIDDGAISELATSLVPENVLPAVPYPEPEPPSEPKHDWEAPVAVAPSPKTAGELDVGDKYMFSGAAQQFTVTGKSQYGITVNNGSEKIPLDKEFASPPIVIHKEKPLESPEPAMPIKPYGSPWQSGGKAKYDHIKDLLPGEQFADKTGAKYTVYKHNAASSEVQDPTGSMITIPHTFVDAKGKTKPTRVKKLSTPLLPLQAKLAADEFLHDQGYNQGVIDQIHELAVTHHDKGKSWPDAYEQAHINMKGYTASGALQEKVKQALEAAARPPKHDVTHVDHSSAALLAYPGLPTLGLAAAKNKIEAAKLTPGQAVDLGNGAIAALSPSDNLFMFKASDGKLFSVDGDKMILAIKVARIISKPSPPAEPAEIGTVLHPVPAELPEPVDSDHSQAMEIADEWMQDHGVTDPAKLAQMHNTVAKYKEDAPNASWAHAYQMGAAVFGNDNMTTAEAQPLADKIDALLAFDKEDEEPAGIVSGPGNEPTTPQALGDVLFPGEYKGDTVADLGMGDVFKQSNSGSYWAVKGLNPLKLESVQSGTTAEPTWGDEPDKPIVITKKGKPPEIPATDEAKAIANTLNSFSAEKHVTPAEVQAAHAKVQDASPTLDPTFQWMTAGYTAYSDKHGGTGPSDAFQPMLDRINMMHGEPPKDAALPEGFEPLPTPMNPAHLGLSPGDQFLDDEGDTHTVLAGDEDTVDTTWTNKDGETFGPLTWSEGALMATAVKKAPEPPPAPAAPSPPASAIHDYNWVKLSGGKAAGGSTGAQVMNGPAGYGPVGNKWLLKTYGGDEDRVATELLANGVYRALGVKAAEAGKVKVNGKYALTYPLADGKEAKFSGVDDAKMRALGQDYMADALLANYDFAGLVDDNVLWNGDEPTRIDQGGTFMYRAQGKPKEYGPVPNEVWSMLTIGQGKNGVKVSESQMRQQAAHIGATLTPDKVDALVDQAPFKSEQMREQVRSALKARVQWMKEFGAGQHAVPAEVKAKLEPDPAPPPEPAPAMFGPEFAVGDTATYATDSGIKHGTVAKHASLSSTQHAYVMDNGDKVDQSSMVPFQQNDLNGDQLHPGDPVSYDTMSGFNYVGPHPENGDFAQLSHENQNVPLSLPKALHKIEKATPEPPPEPDMEPAAAPEMPITPYGSKWASGGAFTYPHIAELEPGDQFRDKEGTLYTVAAQLTKHTKATYGSGTHATTYTIPHTFTDKKGKTKLTRVKKVE